MKRIFYFVVLVVISLLLATISHWAKYSQKITMILVYIYEYGVDYRELTKYCINSELGEFGKDSFTDNKIILDPEDDSIIAHWGGACQLKKNKTN